MNYLRAIYGALEKYHQRYGMFEAFGEKMLLDIQTQLAELMDIVTKDTK